VRIEFEPANFENIFPSYNPEYGGSANPSFTDTIYFESTFNHIISKMIIDHRNCGLFHFTESCSLNSAITNKKQKLNV